MAKGNESSGYKGVQIRANGSVRIRVKWQEKWVWESLDLRATATGLKRAAQIRQEVLERDRIGAVDWREYFPDSSRGDPIEEPTGCPLFGELAEQYLRHRATDTSPSTYRGYRIRLDGIWCPAFASIPIDQIRKSQIMDVIHAKGWTSGKTLSNALTPLRGVFDLAIDDELISRNPAARIKGPKTQKPPPDPLSAEEMHAVLKCFKEHFPGWLPYFQIAFGSGMRTSELIALRWADVDQVNRTMRVHQTRVSNTDKLTTKSGRERTLPITPLAGRGIKAQRAKTELHSDHVFLHPSTGQPIQSDLAPRRAWDKCLVKAEIRHRKAYSTRHTFATLNLLEGVNVLLVSEWLGHASTSMTLDHYAKWVSDGGKQGKSIKALR